MMRLIMLLLILFPCLGFAQATNDNYEIYSQYLKNYPVKKGRTVHFVVRESTDYIRKYDPTGINDIITGLRNYLNGDRVSILDVRLRYKDFADTLKKDTMWMPLIAELNKKMKREFVVENKFSKDLNLVVMNKKDYNFYFYEAKDLEKSWSAFYNHYTKSAVLIELSEIATEGNRAVFYIIEKCGGLCGKSYIVFGYKENNKWKFIPTLPLQESS